MKRNNKENINTYISYILRAPHGETKKKKRTNKPRIWHASHLHPKAFPAGFTLCLKLCVCLFFSAYAFLFWFGFVTFPSTGGSCTATWNDSKPSWTIGVLLLAWDLGPVCIQICISLLFLQHLVFNSLPLSFPFSSCSLWSKFRVPRAELQCTI